MLRPCNCSLDFLTPDILNKCGRAVPAQSRALRRTRTTVAEGPRWFAPARHHLDSHDHDVCSPSQSRHPAARPRLLSLTQNGHWVQRLGQFRALSPLPCAKTDFRQSHIQIDAGQRGLFRLMLHELNGKVDASLRLQEISTLLI